MKLKMKIKFNLSHEFCITVHWPSSENVRERGDADVRQTALEMATAVEMTTAKQRQ